MSVSLPAYRTPDLRSTRGTASIEFILFTPFVLVLMAAVWDLRAFTAHRTDLARELYVAAELLAGNGNEWDAQAAAAGGEVPEILDQVADRLGANGAGWIELAVVRRGTLRAGTTLCPAHDSDDPAASWCLPRAGARPARVAWNGGGDCGARASQLPATAGAHFAADAPVLPNETAAVGSVSRKLGGDEWWVVLEVCSHFGGGTSNAPLLGRLWAALPWLDVGTALVRRAAWGSVEDVGDCDWCG